MLYTWFVSGFLHGFSQKKSQVINARSTLYSLSEKPTEKYHMYPRSTAIAGYPLFFYCFIFFIFFWLNCPRLQGCQDQIPSWGLNERMRRSELGSNLTDLCIIWLPPKTGDRVLFASYQIISPSSSSVNGSLRQGNQCSFITLFLSSNFNLTILRATKASRITPL